MTLTHIDTIQTTSGPLAPLSMLDYDSYIYGYDVGNNEIVPVISDDTVSPGHVAVTSAMLVTLSAKNLDGTNKAVFLPWEFDVLMGKDGEWRPAHEMKVGETVAYFTRVMRHEKYSAMRVIPYMSDRVLEHRWVWETHEQMEVPRTHNVDHINMNTYDNSYSNLRALDIRSHSRMTAHRQRNRHTRRNADGSFAKGSTTKRIASADKPIPEHLHTGTLTGACRVVSIEEAEFNQFFFTYEILTELERVNTGIIYGGLVVQP